MWVLNMVQDNKAWLDANLDSELAEALAGGAEFLSTFLSKLIEDPQTPMPETLTCNICDRQIQPWFFEKHTALCIVSHRSESEVQDCHDHLQEQRQIIADVLQQLETDASNATFHGIPIGARSSSPLANSPTSSAKKPQKAKTSSLRTVELILDYCDTAIEINTPALPDAEGADVFTRIQSPDSRNRLAQLQEWQAPILEDPALTALYQSTHELVTQKLHAVTRLHNTIHYSEKIRQEIDLRVQDLIDQTLENAQCMLDEDTMSEVTEHLTDDSPFGPPVQRSGEDVPGLGKALASLKIGSPTLFATREPPSETKDEGSSGSATPFNQGLGTGFSSPTKRSLPLADGALDGELRAASPLSQFPPVSVNDPATRRFPPRVPMQRSISATSDNEQAILSSGEQTRRGSADADTIRRTSIPERRQSRAALYDIPRLPSGGSNSGRAPAGYSPSRRSSRAVSRSRASSLARERGASPGRKVMNPRLNLLEKERLSPNASPTLSASDSTSTDPSYRDRKTSMAPPLSPRLPSIAPAARPAPPSIKDFEIIKPISKGAFGSVYLSKKKTTGDYYAIKVLKKADMIAKNQVTNIKAERAIMMAQTESPFIAKLFFTFQSKEYLYLVMEYLNGGDCAALIKQIGCLPEDWTRRYMAEVVLGLEFLHSRGIIHRDLKPDNLLISHNGHLKLTDFGLSRVGLVGRQNRARTSSHPEVPDLFHSQRQSSSAGSRHASFEFSQSALSTPAIGLMSPGDFRSDKSYFNLRERKVSSGEQFDATRSEADSPFSAVNKVNLADPMYQGSDDGRSTGDLSESSGPSKASPSTAPPSLPSAMPPPAMKLFDPNDGNRKFVGTPDYLAPETINGSGQDDMVDWWSLGVILFEFMYGYPPFHAASPDMVFENILNHRIDWPSPEIEVELGVSENAKDLMVKLMAMSPAERLGSVNGAEDIKQHPFFAGITWDTISEEEALFVPTPDHPEDTDYFDPRGATNLIFEDESDAARSLAPSPNASDRETTPKMTYAAKVMSGGKHLGKRTAMPLAIPAHVRERKSRSRRLSEPGRDDFGSFTFKNLGVLEKQNMDAIKRLRSEHSSSSPIAVPADHALHHQRSASSSSSFVRRSMSSASSISSNTPISPSAYLNRSSIPSSPLNAQGSGFSAGHRQRASVSIAPLHENFVSSLNQARPGSSGGDTGRQLSPIKTKLTSKSLPTDAIPAPDSSSSHAATLPSPRSRSFTLGSQPQRPELPFAWTSKKRISRVFDAETPSSSSDNESSAGGVNALHRVQRRRQRSQRLGSMSLPSTSASSSQVCEGSAASTTAAEIPQRRHIALDVLICEDNPVSRRVLEAMLTKLKCCVVSVEDGAQAVAAATGDVVFDIIFTDIKVPRLSGVEVARLIRSSSETNRDTPIVAMSSYSTGEVLDMAHFEKRLEKPLTVKMISETIQELLLDWAPPPLNKRPLSTDLAFSKVKQ
jgi:serine/threonine-protein kinase RIM15